jgi:hypothetical protein
MEKPRPHAFVRHDATGLRGRIGLGNGAPQRLNLKLVQIRVQFGHIDMP